MNAANSSEVRLASFHFAVPQERSKRYPMLRFPWSRAEEALNASDRSISHEPIHMVLVNPESGASLLETMCFSVRMLRPGKEVLVPRRSASAVFQIVEGAGESVIEEQACSWSPHDTIASPTFAQVTHRNTSTKKSAYLVQVDDGPLQSKLGFYEERVQA